MGNLIVKLYCTSMYQAHNTWQNSECEQSPHTLGSRKETETEKKLKTTKIPNPTAYGSLQCVKYHVPDKSRCNNIYVHLDLYRVYTLAYNTM